MILLFFLSLILVASCTASGPPDLTSSDDPFLLDESGVLAAKRLPLSQINSPLIAKSSEIKEILLDHIVFDNLNDFDTFIDGLFSSSNLKVFTLYNCQLTLEWSERLFALLAVKPLETLRLTKTNVHKFSKSLQTIDLEGVTLSKEALKSLASVAQSGNVISQLDFRNVIIEDESLFNSVLYGLRLSEGIKFFYFSFINVAMSSSAYKTLADSLQLLVGIFKINFSSMDCTDEDIKPFFDLAYKLKEMFALTLYANPKLGNGSLINLLKISCLYYGEKSFTVPEFGLLDDSLWFLLATNFYHVPTLEELVVPKFHKISPSDIITLAKAALKHSSLKAFDFQFPIAENLLKDVTDAITAYRTEENITKDISLKFENTPSPATLEGKTFENEEETFDNEENSEEKSGEQKPENLEEIKKDEEKPEEETRRRFYPSPPLHLSLSEDDKVSTPPDDKPNDDESLKSNCYHHFPFYFHFFLLIVLL